MSGERMISGEKTMAEKTTRALLGERSRPAV